MAEAIMIGMFISSVIGTLWYSGKDSAVDSINIRNQVTQVKKQTEDIRDNIKKINDNNLEIDLNIKNAITDSIKKHNQLSQQLVLANNNYIAKLKQIQLIGIMIVGIIGLMLLIKKTGIIKDLLEKDNNLTNKVPGANIFSKLDIKKIILGIFGLTLVTLSILKVINKK